MITGKYNIGICSLGIIFTLQHIKELSIIKSLLIMPLIVSDGTLNYLSNSRTNILSLEELLVKKTSFFSNFNQRYLDSLPVSFNTIQFLNEIEIIQINGNSITLKHIYKYEKSMGKRGENIYKASPNIASILKQDANILYLNLRVEL